MNWTSYDSWIVAVGICCAVACSLPGCFLVLRRMSMMGDAISHAVLPGLAIAFLFSGSRAGWEMFAGAAVAGLLTAVFTQWVGDFGRVDRGAAMGIVFTTLFALGLLLIVQSADAVDLDPGCVLYGNIEWTPLDTVKLGSMEIPRALAVLAGVLIFNLLLILVFFKEFRITSFDPALADACGISASRMHYLLMIMVAVTTVAAFEAVGSILVIAMLVVPPSTAWLLTDRLKTLVILSALLGALGAALGHLAAVRIPGWLRVESLSTSGMMAVMSGLLFLLVWSLHPRNGWIAGFCRRRIPKLGKPSETISEARN